MSLSQNRFVRFAGITGFGIAVVVGGGEMKRFIRRNADPLAVATPARAVSQQEVDQAFNEFDAAMNKAEIEFDLNDVYHPEPNIGDDAFKLPYRLLPGFPSKLERQTEPQPNVIRMRAAWPVGYTPTDADCRDYPNGALENNQELDDHTNPCVAYE